MKKIAFIAITLFFGNFAAQAQDTVTVAAGGSSQYTVGAGCTGGGIELNMGGAPGGGNCGGSGALLNGLLQVSPGDVIDIIVGEAGGCPNPVPAGGGPGQASTNGNAAYNSCSGGGLTQISVNGVVVAVVGAGGGSGGGSVNPCTSNGGGDGGCATGIVGGNSYAQGGQPGTQTGPGAGGTPWAGIPPGGSNGVGSSGGMGGLWQTASGGGGGAGYFGGGGGGNDGCCTGANGGGGGGGGSSLIPAGIGCVTGGNTGDAMVQIIVPVCETTICSGDTSLVDLVDQFPAGATNFTVAPAGTSFQPVPGGSVIGFFPVDTTDFTVSAMSGGVQIDIIWPVNAVDPIFPDAGLDDSLCFDIANAAALNGTLANDGDFYWEFENATTFSGGLGNALFTPDNLTLSTAINANQAGLYEFILFESDTNDVCEDGSDTMFVYYSVEEHVATGTDPDCYQGANGQIVIDSDDSPASGDLGAANYSIDGGVTWQTSNTFTGLTAGTYDIVSEDYLGCQFTSQVVLDDPAEIIVTLASSDTVLCQNGTATINAFGSNAPMGGTYTYTWSPNNSTTGSNVITPAPAGTDETVTVFVTTDLGCVSQPQSLEITHHDPISLTITANDSVCPGYDSQHIVTATGGFNGYTYDWTANGTPTADISDEINMNPTEDTEYCVTVSDVCETTPEVICTNTIMRAVPDPIFMSDATWGCNPSNITFTNTTVVSDSITWLINGTYYYNVDPLTISFEEVGTYDVWLEVYSEYGCFNSMNAADYITIHDVPDPLFYINPNPTTIFNTGLEMNNITPGANNTYSWSFPGGSPASSSLVSPSVYYPEGIPNDYPIELVATNEWGCSDSITGVAHIVSDVIIYAPSIFTPDGDEFNETWKVHIDGIDIYDFHLTMFNRWGEPVWESYNQTAEWKGSYGPNGVQDGTYVWKVECKEIATDKKYEFRGHVTVLK